MLAVAIGAVVGSCLLTERQRQQEAQRVFELVPRMGGRVSSSPLPFRRYCSYLVCFPPQCGLTDQNSFDLTELNELDQENVLRLVIETMNLTDLSVPHLAAIETIDSLDVTKPSISNEGIESIRQALPNSDVRAR
jgi:hypothetical protein